MPCDYQKIKQDNIRRRGEEFDDIGHFISQQLYNDPSHFVYELLQNSEDALERRFQSNDKSDFSCSVKFLLYKDRLEFRHYGQPFNESDVRGISDILKGSKSKDDSQIGKFGIGFKSVYSFTSTPFIYSGEEHFFIERYIRPQEAEPHYDRHDEETLFIFPFNHNKGSKEEVFNVIAEKLKKLGSRVLLFLNRIDEIEWVIESKEEGIYLKDTEKMGMARRVTVIGQTNHNEEVLDEETWLVFDRPVIIGSDKIQKKVEVAFQLVKDEKEQKERVIKIEDSPLVVYFPTEKQTFFGFLIQGPYKTTASRDNVQENDDLNRYLVKETTQLLVDSLFEMKKLGLLTVSLLETLPLQTEKYAEDSMFYPFSNEVQKAFLENELLPAEDGSYVSVKNAKLPRVKELKELLNPDQLTSLYRSTYRLKWLTSEITINKTPGLRNYLIKKLDVEEVTSEVFIRNIKKSFLERQTDEWVINFYRFLKNQTALFKGPAKYGISYNKPLLKKSFIRLQDNSHVRPYQEDNSPNVYLAIEDNSFTDLPCVKRNISQDDEVMDFLKELKIPELDIVEEVIRRVLPKYNDSSYSVGIKEHIQDLVKIEKAYNTSGFEKRRRLVNTLRKTPFILAEGADRSYHKPAALYEQNKNLSMYFSGNDEIKFVKSGYKKASLELFKELGIRTTIKTNRRTADDKGYVVIASYKGCHIRGHNNFDPHIEVEGLEYALKNPEKDKSQFIWNHIVIPNASCIEGQLEKCTRQSYSGSTIETITSNFGQMLKDIEWLPGFDGAFYKPSQLRINDLPESFIRESVLVQKLGMKTDIDKNIVEKIGISTEDVYFIKEYSERFKEWKESMLKENNKSSFPKKRVKDSGRRQEKIIEEIKSAPNKEFDIRERSVKKSTSKDEHSSLRAKYTNEDHEMFCQICKKVMPFKKRDGEYYFEAVEFLSSKYFEKELEAQYIALCPLCAAMYKEFVKRDEEAMDSLKNNMLESDDCLEFSLSLGEVATSIQFVETHYSDLKAIIKEITATR